MQLFKINLGIYKSNINKFNSKSNSLKVIVSTKSLRIDKKLTY